MANFYDFRLSNKKFPESSRILAQAKEAGFSGRLKIYNLGFDTEDSMSLIIEGWDEQAAVGDSEEMDSPRTELKLILAVLHYR